MWGGLNLERWRVSRGAPCPARGSRRSASPRTAPVFAEPARGRPDYHLMRLGVIEGPSVSVLRSSANASAGRCVGVTLALRDRAARSAAAGLPFCLLFAASAIGIEFVPIKTKLALPRILNRLWRSSLLTLLEPFLQILLYRRTMRTENHCKMLIVCTFPRMIGVMVPETTYYGFESR